MLLFREEFKHVLSRTKIKELGKRKRFDSLLTGVVVQRIRELSCPANTFPKFYHHKTCI